MIFKMIPVVNRAHLNILVAGVLLLMTSFSFVAPYPWSECDAVVFKEGLNVLNCSGKDLIELPSIAGDVEYLDMSNNRFTELPEIKEADHCEKQTGEGRCHVQGSSTNHCRFKISFSRNEINRFSESALHELMCLSVLDLSYNEITHEILHLNTFQEAATKIFGCSLYEAVTVSEGNGVYNLKTLILRGNPLGVLPDNVLAPPFMVDLRELDLSHCNLHDIGKDSVDDHSKLKVLNLSYNKLTTIHPETFKGLFSLELLDLRENQLTYLPQKVFGDLTALTTLLLSNNRVQLFHADAFFSDSSLSFLDLTYNLFTRIPYEALDKLPKLTTLDLSHNPMDNIISSSGTSSVKTLILDNLHALTILGPNALASFPNLVNLSISDCKLLSSIDPLVLGSSQVPNLRQVKLDRNALETLSPDTFPWKQLSYFSLSGNPWTCDVRLTWMIVAKAKIPRSPVCKKPLKLNGRELFDIKKQELGRYYSPRTMTSIIVFVIAFPLAIVFIYLLWKRRRFFVCVRTKVKGRYMSVYTRDIDGEDDHVDIELKANANRLSSVSNGSADDTKPFVTLEHDTAKENVSRPDDDEEEEI